MNISSVIVIPNPDRIDSVVAALKDVAGVDVAVVSPEGKIIITIESDSDRETIQTYEHVSVLDGVLSAAMVYHQKEDQPDSPITVAA